MLLKICYAPCCAQYFMNVSNVKFVSHLSEFATQIKPSTYPMDNLLCSDEYLKDNIGCSSVGDDDEQYYMSCVSGTCVLPNTGKTTYSESMPFKHYYTGTAYLCDDSGKTIDTLR